jgi:large subunit ribosomal protein L5
MNRLQKLYKDKVVKKLQKKFKQTNVFTLPKVDKIVINMGIGDVIKDKKARGKIMNYMTQICGQRPQYRQINKSIAEFNVRRGDVVGIRATLRGQRMYAFLDKLISVVLPRERDFRGVPLSSFDGQGNYNLGLKEQIIFPEVEYDTIDRIRGLQITIKIINSDRQKSEFLLREFGMPFEKLEEK